MAGRRGAVFGVSPNDVPRSARTQTATPDLHAPRPFSGPDPPSKGLMLSGLKSDRDVRARGGGV